MRLIIGISIALSLAVPAAASAAVKAGSYSGTSSGKFQEYGKLEMTTDKGRVSFKVRSGKVLKFKITGQRIQCGAGGHEIAISIASIKLDRNGRGKATYTNPDVGDFKVSIRVTSRGTASGKVVPQGLCSQAMSFTAKRR